MRLLLCIVVCLLGWGSQVESTLEDDDRKTEEYKEKFRRVLESPLAETAPPAISDLRTVGIPDFECQLDSSEPTDIHHLSPPFVDVVAAMGDSVTAAMGAGASTIIGDLIEYRGLSWSVGGDNSLETVATLPNMLKLFNPNLKGYSVKTGKPSSVNAKLNVAVSGAVTSGMPGQAETLVRKMNEMEVTDEDWKVITMWIGGNDFCAIKTGGKSASELAAEYVAHIEQALNYLKANVKRAYVNVVQMLDIADLHIISESSIGCYSLHLIACPSILNAERRSKVTEARNFYNQYLEDLIGSGKYASDDFTVELQPFFIETAVPRKENNSPDKSYFAPDCFHFSQKGHAIGARYLWNNMFQEKGQKTQGINWESIEPLKCPSENPYFATTKKSAQGDVSFLNVNSSGQNSHDSTDLLAILVGTGVGVVLVAVVAIVVAVGVIKMRRGRRGLNERMQLLSFKS